MHDACVRCGLFHPAGTSCLALTLTAAPADGLAAETLLAGRYRIARTIHRGGMSTVYLAEDTLLHGRAVALKELRPPAEASVEEVREAEAWFARESALLSGLRHPLIPAFYSVFREGGRSYIAQEYIEGENLDEVVRDRGAVSPEQVVDWGLALCGLLEYLHSLPEPVIFRDLKPANVLLRASFNAPDHRLAVVDFGIARPYQQGSVGTVIGTPGYAPPEQYQGLATPRSDIYALGATLYRLLTAYDPERGTPFTFPPIGDLNPAVPTLLAGALERAVALNPADRYETATDFGRALRALRLRPVPAGTTRRRGSRGHAGAWVVAAVLLFPLVLSQVFRSTGSSMPGYIDSTGSMSMAPAEPFVGISTAGLPCTGSTVGGQPSSSIACGPDNAIWFIDPQATTTVDRVDADGTLTSYPVPAQYRALESITAGLAPCQCVWLTTHSNSVLRMDIRDGSITAFPVPGERTTLSSATLGSDGTLWLALMQQRSRIVSISPSGDIRSFTLQDGAEPSAITGGPDGTMWFTESRQVQGQPYGFIGRITAQGVITEWRIPTPNSMPRAIAEGLDANLWFTEEYGNKLGRITPDGRITEYALPTPDAEPMGIVAGSDGGLWFTEMRSDRVGHLGVLGTSTINITEYSLAPGSHPVALTLGPDGDIWWNGESGGAGAQVGSIDPDGTVQVIDPSLAVPATAITTLPMSGADNAAP